jgi:hypothetical protein
MVALVVAVAEQFGLVQRLLVELLLAMCTVD